MNDELRDPFPPFVICCSGDGCAARLETGGKFHAIIENKWRYLIWGGKGPIQWYCQECVPWASAVYQIGEM